MLEGHVLFGLENVLEISTLFAGSHRSITNKPEKEQIRFWDVILSLRLVDCVSFFALWTQKPKMEKRKKSILVLFPNHIPAVISRTGCVQVGHGFTSSLTFSTFCHSPSVRSGSPTDGRSGRRSVTHVSHTCDENYITSPFISLASR